MQAISSRLWVCRPAINSLRLRPIVVGLGILALLPVGRANAFSWSSLNPFASKSDAPPDPSPKMPRSGSAAAGSGLGSTSTPLIAGKAIHPPAPSQPSLLSRIGSGTANMFTKTKQALTPKSTTVVKSTQVSLGTQQSKPKPKTSDSGSWSWNPFAAKTPDPPKPQTASQFIGLPRPQP